MNQQYDFVQYQLYKVHHETLSHRSNFENLNVEFTHTNQLNYVLVTLESTS